MTSPDDTVDPVLYSSIALKVKNGVALTREEAATYQKKNKNDDGQYRNSSDMTSQLMNPKSRITQSTSSRIATSNVGGDQNGT